MKERLENLRVVKQWTWAQLAESLDLSESMLYQVSAGKKKLSARSAYRLRQTELQAGLKSAPLDKDVEETSEQIQNRGVTKSTPRVLLQPAEGEPMYSIHEQPSGKRKEDPAFEELEFLRLADPMAFDSLKRMIHTCHEAAHRDKTKKKK